MIIAAWALLAAVTCCSHSLSAPVPPVAAALDPPTQDIQPFSSHEESLSPPEKRLLKYLLPNGQSWSGQESDTAPAEYQEGMKRGYNNNKNYLRFGRGEADKRAPGRNFLRFGRGGETDYIADEEVLDENEKRARNFLRFGRGQNRNFLRFGRSGMEDFGIAGGPLEFARGLEDDIEEAPIEEEKRGSHKNYLRFGRGNRNFLRFGRAADRNFLRFGRSVDTELTSCENCEEEQHSTTATDVHATTTPLPSSYMPPQVRPKRSLSQDLSAKDAAGNNQHRIKRSAPAYYDYMMVPSHGPASWARDFQSAEDDIGEESFEVPQEISKRNRNFLRFGRDRNFLRFGKRDGGDASSSSSSPEAHGKVVMVTPVQYPRIVRASQRNFLRFG